MSEKTPRKKKGMTETLRAYAAGAWLAAGGMAGYVHQDEIGRAVFDTQHERDPEIRSMQETLHRIYGVRVEFGIPHRMNGMRGDGLNREEARQAIDQLSRTLAKYPRDFFSRNRLPRIIIARNVFLDESPNETYVPGGNVAGVARNHENLIVVEYFGKEPEQLREFEATFDHEIYHVLDYRDRGYEEDDAAWTTLHDACTCTPYGTPPDEGAVGEMQPDGGMEAGEAPVEPMADEPPPFDPFQNRYGSWNPVEDRATFAESMMSPMEHVRMRYNIEHERDPLSRQIRQQKYDLIREEYRRWSGGAMDDAYWERQLARGRALLEAQGIDPENPNYMTFDYQFEYDYEYYGPHTGEGEPYLEYESADSPFEDPPLQRERD